MALADDDLFLSLSYPLPTAACWPTVAIKDSGELGFDHGGRWLLNPEPPPTLSGLVVIHNNRMNRMAPAGDESFKFLTYQLPTVRYWPTVAMTGNGELGFDSGEGA